MKRFIVSIACACTLIASAANEPASGQPAAAAEPRRDTPAAAARSARNANYDIDVRLDPERRELRGRETIVWRNISTQTARELQFHLYWNAWRNADSTWLREGRISGAASTARDEDYARIDVTAIRLLPQDSPPRELTTHIRFIAPDDGNPDDRTVMSVPAVVDPGTSVTIEIEWTSKIPHPFARTGAIGDSYFIAQWFPKIGVLEDSGWNTHQFHRATEFYADFGVYDVKMTVPRGFVLGASGREMSRNDSAAGTTHHYRAEDVHDFAWTASPHLLDLHKSFEHPSLPAVDMRLLLQPERREQADRYFAIVAATLKLYGEWFGAYPYGHVTVVDPAFQSLSDGMEYPTFFTGRSRWLAPPSVQTPEMTTAHEAGHQWWYGMVASNEFERAWMDEGINTFATARVVDEVFRPNRVEARFFGGFIPWAFRNVPFTRADNDRLAGYRLNAEADAPSTPTWNYWPSTATFISYNKTALWLHTLENHLGWPVLQRILATYFDRWKFRHPRPEDFFAVANEVAGTDLTWFFDQVYRSSNTFDYGVQELLSERTSTGDYRTVVVARRYGEATFPIEVVTTFADGEQIKEKWDGLERRAMYVYERKARAASAQVDPRRVLLLDINYTNNGRSLQPASARASLKWAMTWMVWLQDLMLTYGFFV